MRGVTPTGGPSVPKFAVKINGAPLKDVLVWQTVRISVDDRVDLPSMFTMELDATDTLDAEVDWLDNKNLFGIGDPVEIQLPNAGGALQTVINAEVTLIEIEWTAAGLPRLTVHGYDRRHRLQRGQKLRTFVKKTDSEIARQIATEAGLSAQVVATSLKHEYLIQANQTDFAFLQERARRIHYELVVEDKTLHYRPVALDAGAALTLSMDKELHEFRARLSSAGQVSEATVRGWNVKEKASIVGNSKRGALMGGQSDGGQLTEEVFGKAQTVIAEPVSNGEEAGQRADAEYAATALSLVRSEGSVAGRSDLKAGKVIKIEGVGKRFSGPYYLTEVTHRYAPEGFTSHFIAWRNAT